MIKLLSTREKVLFVILVALIVLFLSSCTTTKTVVERVEVPQPYWDPPKAEMIEELPARTPMLYETITPMESMDDVRSAFQALGEDIRALLQENEEIRHMYEQLVLFVTAQYVPEGGNDDGTE